MNVVTMLEKIDLYDTNYWLDEKTEYFILIAKKDWKIIPKVAKNDKLFFKVTNEKEYWKYYLYRIEWDEFWLVKIDNLTKNINFDIVWVLVKIIRDL